MMRTTLVVSLAFALLAPASCSNDAPTTTPAPLGELQDTLGKRFTLSCSSELCSLTPVDPTLASTPPTGPVSCSSAQGTDTYVLVLGRVLTAHLMNYPGSGRLVMNTADPAHPIACTSDACCALGNAPTTQHAYSYSCLNGICQDTSVGLAMRDIIALCQADLPWPTTCPYIASQPFASRLNAIATLCAGEPSCQRIPADCWQLLPAPDGGGAPSGALDAAAADAGFAGSAPDLGTSE